MSLYRFNARFSWFGRLFWLWLLGCALGCQSSGNPTITLTPPTSSTASPTAPGVLIFPTRAEDNSHEYYQQLLEQSLAAIGQPIPLQLTEPLPQKRATEMLAANKISLLWMLQTAERDAKFVPVEVDLTNGLISQRILLIRPQDAERFAQVRTVDDLRQLAAVGAFGKGWFDAKVWEYNQLPYLEVDGDWSVIYAMVANGQRGLDYFSRGFTEVRADATAHPKLMIEEHLVLVYARDFRFYLAPAAAHYRPVLEQALTQARDSGLMDELIRAFWAEDFALLSWEARHQIQLATPP